MEAGDSRAAARFQREARAAAGLRCEHVVRVIDFGYLHKDSPFLVMEFVEGQSLAALLLRYGPMHPPDAVRATLHACAALAEAHALGIIHRDLKPANLLLSSRSDGSPLIKLADFGVALPKETEIRVWDSTAELRYLVLPLRPAGTEGWSEDRLADLVTRDSMIGTGLALEPGAAQ